MLRLVTGRIGSGKTTRIYNEIGNSVEQGREVTLIVPEQYSFHTEKKMLELLGARGADKVNVVSFSFLASNLLKKYGLNSKICRLSSLTNSTNSAWRKSMICRKKARESIR